MRKVTEKTFKVYARDAVKELNTLELTAELAITALSAEITLLRDTKEVGHISITADGWVYAKDFTRDEVFNIVPEHDTMKDLFSQVYQTVNGLLDNGWFWIETAELQETEQVEEVAGEPKEGRTITVTLHPVDEEEERTITYTGVKSISLVAGKAAERIEAHTDESSIDKDHEYMVIIFEDRSKATFRRSSVVKVQEEGKLPVIEEEEDEPTVDEKAAAAEEVKLNIVRIHLDCRIKSWYENAKIDYGISGRFLDCKVEGDNLLIFHEEEGKKYITRIGYYKDYTPEQIYNIWMENGGCEMISEEIERFFPQEAEEPQPTPEEADREVTYIDFKPEQDYSEEEQKEIAETVAGVGLELLEKELTELEKLEEESDKADDAWDKDPLNAELEAASSKAYEKEGKKYMDAAKTLARLINMDTKTARQMLQRGSKNREKVWNYLKRRKIYESK